MDKFRSRSLAGGKSELSSYRRSTSLGFGGTWSKSYLQGGEEDRRFFNALSILAGNFNTGFSSFTLRSNSGRVSQCYQIRAELTLCKSCLITQTSHYYSVSWNWKCSNLFTPNSNSNFDISEFEPRNLLQCNHYIGRISQN